MRYGPNTFLLRAAADKKCVGIEIDPTLAAKAAQNAKALLRRKAPVQIVNLDACSASYDDATIAILYNPFGHEVLIKVLAKLGSIGHRLRIVYINPVHEEVFRKFPVFRLSGRYFAPYQAGKVEIVLFDNSGIQ